MAELQFETTVDAPIVRVWALYLDPERVLTALTPPEQKLVIESIQPIPVQVGTRLAMSVNTPAGRKRWVAEIIELQPPHGTITGMEARFVDKQISGPFKRWRHAHELEAVDDRTTRCIDHISYDVGYGPIGWTLDATVVRPAIKKMFAYREAKLKALLR